MIPLVLMAGFLGAGKTRLLTQLVPALAALGIRTRIVLNDFQNARVDAARLGALEALVTPLNGECICCGSLRELLQTLYDVPPDPGSVMLIEANGATETDELLAHLTTDGQLRHFTLPLQLTVVDAARWQKRWWHNGLERAQMSTATHVHLNWTERVSTTRLEAVRASLSVENSRAAYVDATAFARALHELSCAVAVDVRLGGRSAMGNSGLPPAATARPRDERAAHTHPFGSATLPLPALVSRHAFEQWVQALPPSVVRAKGLVRFADDPGPMYVWHRVPGRSRVRLDASWPHADAEPTALFIGVAMSLDVIAEGTARLAVADTGHA
ncbi:CobW family GTP-binding protein [Gemmatimonas sp.]